MKILMVGFDAPWIFTGFASTLRSIGGELLKRGHEVYSICGNFVFETDGPISHNGLIILSNKGCDLYPNKDLFLKHYESIKPDVVLAHNDYYRISYVSELPQDIINKMLVWLPIEDTDSFAEIENLKKMKNIAFTTNYGVNLYKDLLINQRVFKISHQVSSDFSLSDDAFLRDIEKIKNKFIVLRVDRNQSRKKWESTFRSFESFVKDYGIKDAVLIAKTRKRDIVSKQDLGELVKKLDIEEQVHFVESDLTTPQMRSIYDYAHVFLSTTGSEGFGLSIGEAMVCSKPIICTGCSPLLDVVGKNAGSFIKVKKKDYDHDMHIHYNTIDIEHAASLLKEYYDDWKSGGKRIALEGYNARINSLDYKVERVVDEFEKVFNIMMVPHEKLLIAIATKNRPVPLTALLTSIFNQTYKSHDIFIFDNSDNEDLLTNNTLMKQMDLLRSYGHNVCVWKNDGQNAPDTHQKIFELGKQNGYEYIFKLDDDCILENNVIEVLMDTIQSNENAGAVGCPILNLPGSKTSYIMPIDYPSQTLDNIHYNRQWTWNKNLVVDEVEHLHSSFIYRTRALDQIGGFPKGLSKVAFREETLATYPMFLKGWKLYYDPKCIIWHTKADHGGCRDSNIEELYARDDEQFWLRIKQMKI